MKKRLLSIITSISLLSSAFSFGVSAVPSAVGTIDTGVEYFPEVFEEEKFDAELAIEGPSAVDVMETAVETNTEFGRPELFDGASLFSELSGEGTEESPYLIGSAEDLKLMANNINTGVDVDAYYKLTDDIDLGGEEWEPIGFVTGTDPNTDYSKAFSGHFDGDGHTVSNFVITKGNTAYVGFFGFIYDGTVENLTLDSVTIDIDSTATYTHFVGGVAGRVIANSRNARSNIINCHIKNSDISVVGAGIVYAGGIIGAGVTGAYDGAHIFIGFSSAECDINASTTSAALSNTLVAAGGIAGYYGGLTRSKLSAINSYAKGNVYASSLNSYYSHALAGGAFGNLRTYDDSEYNQTLSLGGSLYVDSCYSEGTVVAESDYQPYKAGGFMAQFFSTPTSYISNCYSSSDTSGRHLQKGNPYAPNNDPVAGGFVGMLEFNRYSSSMGKTITNCYAQGDAVDLTHTSADAKDTSFVGAFAGYSTAGVWKNCYKLASQYIWGSDVFYDDIVTLSQEDVKYHDKYVGFDYADTWDFDASSDYPYPTLKEKAGFVDFVVEGVSVATAVFGIDGRVRAPETDPEKNSTVDKVFKFNYWSLSENGTAFNFGAETLTKNTTLYAVFTPITRQYKVRFISEDDDFVPVQSIDYGSVITAPEEIPVKEDNETYFYEFLYWSEKVNGEPADFTDYTVKGDHTFYAVYEEIDKSAWRGEIAESFSSGYGTEISPYIIRTSEEFALLATLINEKAEGYTDAYYALGNDINLGSNFWIPVGRSESTPFSANFDGRGYSIGNFILSNNKYSGLFGYVRNATIKNVHITNYKIELSIQKEESEKYDLYAGGLAGYLSAKDGFTSSVSCVRVSNVEYDIDVSVANLYLGHIAGYTVAENKSNVYITDSFATGDISATNVGGYNYIGGITGSGWMWSLSSFLISRCYSVGDITSNSYRSTHAAGLVGYLYSNGSAYLSGEEDDDDNASLAVDDYDVMLSYSFAVTSVTSKTTGAFSNSYIGYLVGELNTYAEIESIAYPINAGLSLSPVTNTKIGSGTAHANLQNQNYLKTNYGFDFENTWVFTPEYKYPVLKCMIVNKPAIRMSAALTEGLLDVAIQVVTQESDYTVIIGVYNARNQLIKAERHNLGGGEMVEVNTSYENMDKAARVSVSAVEKYSLKPLFEGVTVEL